MPDVLYSFVESKRFTRDVLRLLTEDGYFALQEELLQYPTGGDLIRGSGGLRKVRWNAPGRGKRGGARVIYYFADTRGYIFLLDIYPKNEKENLTPAEIGQLRDLVEEWLHEYRKL